MNGAVGGPEHGDAGTDAGRRITASASRLEDIVQFALKAHAIRPVSEVGKVELQVWVLDDADHIVKISWPAGSQFHENEILGRGLPNRHTMKINSAAPIEHSAIEGAR